MPHIGFHAVVLGIWEVSISTLTLAVWELGRAYVIQGSGTEIAITGSAKSAGHLGSFIPNVDNEGRQFPNRLTGRTLVFEIDGGISIGSPRRIKIKFQSLQGSQPILYEWEGRIPISAVLPNDFTIDGTIRRSNSGGISGDADERKLFDDLMWLNHNAEEAARNSLLRNAHEQAAENRLRRILRSSR